jgi:hypothetical protein|tara:strand:- start:854 stop:1627 length:774 start_codon:yes stop_codon:yes gene_type:complete
MITLLSPAKTLDYESPLPVKDFSVPGNLKQSKQLIKALRKKDPQDLSDLMGLSEKLANLNFERNMNWEPPVKHSDDIRQAIFAFKGDVYTGLSAYSLKKSDINFLDKHVRILSGLYGILKPLDLMSPYRLEMGTKLETSEGKDLYEFWGQEITNSINESISTHKSKYILNLASVEYFSSVKKDLLNGEVISPVFKDYKNGKYKIISFFAKKARGSMTRYLVENRIDSPKDISGFDYDGYKYSKSESTEYSPVFLRKA